MYNMKKAYYEYNNNKGKCIRFLKFIICNEFVNAVKNAGHTFWRINFVKNVMCFECFEFRALWLESKQSVLPLNRFE